MYDLLYISEVKNSKYLRKLDKIAKAELLERERRSDWEARVALTEGWGRRSDAIPEGCHHCASGAMNR